MTLTSNAVYADDGVTTEEDIIETNHLVATKWGQFNRSVDLFFTNKEDLKRPNKSSVMFYTSFYKTLNY